MSIVYDSAAKTVTIDSVTESIKDVITAINTVDPGNAEIDSAFGWVLDIEIVIAAGGTLLIDADFCWAMRGSTYFNWQGHLYLDKRSITRIETSALALETATTMANTASFTSVRHNNKKINPQIIYDYTLRHDFPTISRTMHPVLINITGLDLVHLSGLAVSYFKLYFGNAATVQAAENIRYFAVAGSSAPQFFNTTYDDLVTSTLKIVSDFTDNVVTMNNPAFELDVDQDFNGDIRGTVWYINNPVYVGAGQWTGLFNKKDVRAGSKFYYQFGSNLVIKSGLTLLPDVQIKWTRADVAVPFYAEPNTEYSTITGAAGDASQLLLDAYTEELTNDVDRFIWTCTARRYEYRSYSNHLFDARVCSGTGETTEEFQVANLTATLNGIDEATAAALSGISISEGSIVVTSPHTIHEIWAYYRWWISRLANFAVHDVVDFDGTVFDLGGWMLTLDTDLAGVTISNASAVTLTTGRTYSNLTFSQCGQVDPSGASVSGCTFSGYAGTAGALLWPPVPDISGCSFVDNDRAVEVTQAVNQIYDGLTFSSNTYDTHLNNGGVDIEIEKYAGSNPATQISTGGGTITYTDPVIRIMVSNPNLADGTRIRLFNVTKAAELDNIVISGGVGYILDIDVITGGAVEMGDTLRMTSMYSSGTTYYKETDESAIVSGSDITMTAEQTVNDILTGYAIDGSAQTDFTADFPNIEIDINSGDTTRQQLLCWLAYIETTADGIREFFGAIVHEDAGNAKIISSVVDLHIDYVGTGNARFTDNMRLYRDDGTTIFAGTGDNFYAESGKIYVAETGVSGLTPEESIQLSALGPAVQDVKSDTELISAIENGRWLIKNNQQVFYKPDNVTEIARFNLFDIGGNPSETNVYERVRV